MSPINWLRQWLERRRARKVLLATPGVDLLVRRVMDSMYGKHHWRVRAGILEAEVQSHGQGDPWWGPIGPLRDAGTRRWLRDGARGVSHAKPEAPYKLEPVEARGYYDHNYVDTEPLDDDGRTSK